MPNRQHTVSPWRTAYELLIASRTSREAQESVTIKTVTTGTLAGSHAVEVVSVRQDGESLQGCADRANVVYESAYQKHNGETADQ